MIINRHREFIQINDTNNIIREYHSSNKNPSYNKNSTMYKKSSYNKNSKSLVR